MAIYKHIRLRIQNRLFAFLYIQEAKNSYLQGRLPDMLNTTPPLRQKSFKTSYGKTASRLTMNLTIFRERRI